MTTFAEATLELAKLLMQVGQGTATGGNGTTLVDTARAEPNAWFTGGTIWFITGNNAGKSAKITTWDLATKTFTFVTPGAACALGDRYFAAPIDYPREQLWQAINQAYTTLYKVPTAYTLATFVTVANQESYALPTGASAVFDVLRVEIAYNTDSPYEWVKQYNWHELAGRIYFSQGYIPDVSDKPIRLWYADYPAELDGDADTIHDLIHIDLLKWKAAENALRWKLPNAGEKQALVRDLLNEALANAERMERASSKPRMMRDPHYSNW